MRERIVPGWHVRIYRTRYAVACRECGAVHTIVREFALSMN